MNEPIMWDDPIDEKIYNYLDLDSPKSFMLYAGAGSGKTRTLVAVLEALRGERGTRLALAGKRIGIVTYTNAACEEIKHRLKQDPLFSVSTIHSFSWELVKPFTDDIRKWLHVRLTNEIVKLESDIKRARDPQGITAQRNLKSLNGKTKRLESLATIKSFSYTPNSLSIDRGSLNHAEVIAVAAEFLANQPLMGNIFVSQYPIFLIDETQDTNESLLNAIIAVQQAYPDSLSVGLFGDTMQRIYSGGKRDLKETLPKTWLTPEKIINHRCPESVIKLINKIRLIDDTHQQEPSNQSIEGHANIFIIDANKKINKADVEDDIRRKMQILTTDDGWIDRSEVKILTLEHHMAAVRGGFDNFFLPLLSVDRLRDSALNNQGKEINFLQLVLLPLINFIIANDDFGIASVVRRYSPILAATNLKSHADPITEIRRAQLVVDNLRAELQNPACTIINFLRVIAKGGLFDLPDLFLPHLINSAALVKAPEVPEDAALESDESMAWSQALSAPIHELGEYSMYQSDGSTFGTHQGVKGLQYDRVMVILDDEEARGFLFNFEKLLGAVPQSANDIKNEQDGNDSSAKRSRRLFYVTCSRARKSLAVVAYTRNPVAVKKYIRDFDWFSEENTHCIQ
jgi:DNA helicase-2/ATP-dependent DNA helicase PcrA